MADTSRANFVSQAEFARARGVSRKTVTGWKQKGLLVLDGEGRIDVEATEWNLDQRPATYDGWCYPWPVRGQDGNNATHTQAPLKPAAQRLKSTPLPRPASSAVPGWMVRMAATERTTIRTIRFSTSNERSSARRITSVCSAGSTTSRKKKPTGRSRGAEAAFFDEARAFRDAWIAWPGRIAIEMAERILIDPQTARSIRGR